MVRHKTLTVKDIAQYSQWHLQGQYSQSLERMIFYIEYDDQIIPKLKRLELLWKLVWYVQKRRFPRHTKTPLGNGDMTGLDQKYKVVQRITNMFKDKIWTINLKHFEKSLLFSNQSTYSDTTIWRARRFWIKPLSIDVNGEVRKREMFLGKKGEDHCVSINAKGGECW